MNLYNTKSIRTLRLYKLHFKHRRRDSCLQTAGNCSIVDNTCMSLLLLRLLPVLICAIGGRRAIERNIYYWIGSKTPPDKASVACIKAVELR
jgi:hypothetical protein